ncbi:MAG TPA: ATPase, T2SS/T4P/T4SS family [Polyangia bacterium]
MFAIVVNEKGGEQKRLEFDKPEVTIGRVQGNDIILPKGNVSKRHSRIVLKDGKFIIVDLKSTNGTYVNGRKITSPLVVKGSDKIYIGDFILSIEELAGAGGAADDSAAMGARPRANTIPPPPPAPRGRPSTVPGTEDDSEPMGAPPPAGAMGPMDDDDGSGASELPEPVSRPPRPSQVPMSTGPASVTQPPTPAPLPPAAPPARSPSQPPPAMAPAARPASRTDLPSMARPAAAPAAAPRPAPPPSRPPTGARPAAAAPPPVVAASPSTKRQVSYASGAAEDQKRQRISDCMREISSRLVVQLDLASRSGDLAADDDLWARAESAASQLVADLSADGSLPAGVEPDALSKDVVQETLGTGPLEELISDDSVREIAVARHDRIFVEREGTLTLAPKWFSSPEAVERVLSRMLQRAGRGRDLEAARGNGMLVEARVEHGLLLTAALPPLAARGPAITIRRPRREAVRLGDLVGQGLLSQGMADFLDMAVKARRNIVVSGPAASGRSTLVTALARAADEGERIVSVEEAEELDLGDGPWIPLVGGRGAKARDAVNNALRLKPERLVVGDVRGAEALDLVGALAGGCDGCVCAVQAGSTRDAVARLTAMARLAPEAPAAEVLADELTRGVHVIVHLTRSAEGEVRVGEIAEMTPMGVQAVFKAEGGRFAPTGHVPSWAEGAPPSTFR